MEKEMKINSSNSTTVVNNPTQGTSQIVNTTSKVSKPKKKKFTDNKSKREKQFKTKSLKLTNKKLQFVDVLQIQHPNGKNESYTNVVKEIDMNNIHPEHYRVIKALVTITNGFLHGKQLDNKSPEMESLNQLIKYSESALIKARERIQNKHQVTRLLAIRVSKLIGM